MNVAEKYIKLTIQAMVVFLGSWTIGFCERCTECGPVVEPLDVVRDVLYVVWFVNNWRKMWI